MVFLLLICYNLIFDTLKEAKPPNPFIYQSLRGFKLYKKMRTYFLLSVKS